MSFTENRKLKTENRLVPFRIRSAPGAKSSENNQAYPQSANDSMRRPSGTIGGFSPSNGTELLIRGSLYGERRRLQSAKYNKLR
jgi:hypothetical protein